MLLIDCPCCGVSAEETEFHPGGEAHVRRASPGASDQDFEAYLFLRHNPRGVHFERWRHVSGCGKWFHVARCTASLRIFGSYRAQTTAPPADLASRVAAEVAAMSSPRAAATPDAMAENPRSDTAEDDA